MYIFSLKCILLLVLQLSFPKNVPHFQAILRPLETAPPCSAGSAGSVVTPLGVERSRIGKDGVFCGDYVNLVRTMSNKLTGDIVKMANGVHISSQISPASLNCR